MMQMTAPSNGQAWLTGKSDNRRFALAFGIGLIFEAGVLAILLPAMTHQSPPPAAAQSIVKLSIIAPSPPAPPAPPPKRVAPVPKPVAPPPPLPTPPPLPVAPPMPMPPPPLPVAPSRPVIHHPPRPRHVSPPRVQPPPAAQAPPAPAPPAMPPPAAPAQPSAGELDLFRAAMQHAVQAAARMPSAAAMAQEDGVARVQFIYRDGVASDIEIIASSGFPILDDAARQAVAQAALPPPPPDFGDAARAVTVDVIFRAAAASVDGD